MNSHTLKRLILTNSRGSVLVLVGLLLFVFIGVAALAIDIGYLSTTRNELQNAADAAALGATRKLGNIYETMIENGQKLTGYDVDTSGDKGSIITVAKVVALQNKAANAGVIIDETRIPSDIQIGFWDSGASPAFEERSNLPNAVRVTVHRDAKNASGPINSFFAGVFGINSSPISARATAALQGQGESQPGELEIPIGLSRKWFNGDPDDWCGNVVKFSPPSEDEACAGWTGFDLGKANKKELNSIIEGDYSPGSTVGDLFYYKNGVAIGDVFSNLLIAYSQHGYSVDGIYEYVEGIEYKDQIEPGKIDEILNPIDRIPLCRKDDGRVKECDDTELVVDPATGKSQQLVYPNPDGKDPANSPNQWTGGLRYAREWETTMVVYDDDTCTPGGALADGGKATYLPIAGYATVIIYDVGYPGDAYVYGRIKCDFVEPDVRSGGANYGVWGSIPGLVE